MQRTPQKNHEGRFTSPSGAWFVSWARISHFLWHHNWQPPNPIFRRSGPVLCARFATELRSPQFAVKVNDLGKRQTTALQCTLDLSWPGFRLSTPNSKCTGRRENLALCCILWKQRTDAPHPRMRGALLRSFGSFQPGWPAPAVQQPSPAPLVAQLCSICSSEPGHPLLPADFFHFSKSQY